MPAAERPRTQAPEPDRRQPRTDRAQTGPPLAHTGLGVRRIAPHQVAEIPIQLRVVLRTFAGSASAALPRPVPRPPVRRAAPAAPTAPRVPGHLPPAALSVGPQRQTPDARIRAPAAFSCLFAQRYGLRRSHIRRATRHERCLATSVLRNSGHPRSKPLELPLLGHRMRSCRSRYARGHYTARNCVRLDPRCAPLPGRPGSPVTSKDPPFSAPLPRRPVPERRHVSVPADRSRATSPYSAPATGCAFPVSSRVPTTRNAARSRSRSPCATATVAHRPPVSRVRPRHRRTRRVRRLDFHQALQGRARSLSDIRTVRRVVTHRPPRRRASSPVTARMGRLRATTRH